MTFSIQAQKLYEIPPGTIKINDSLYIDKGPIDNLMYLEFTKNVKKLWNYTLHDSLKLLELENIDKSLLSYSLNSDQNEKIYNEIILAENLKISDSVDINYYFNYPDYYYHPVIGISKNQAQIFCEWRTDMVNMRWSKELKNDKKEYKKIIYRLPTNEEYILAKKVFREKDKLLIINENSPLKIDLKNLRNKNNFILYNASEYTISDENFKENSLQINNIDQLDSPYTFFRCICELEK